MRIRDLSLDRMDDIFCKDIGEVVPLKDYETSSVNKAYLNSKERGGERGRERGERGEREGREGER